MKMQPTLQAWPHLRAVLNPAAEAIVFMRLGAATVLVAQLALGWGN